MKKVILPLLLFGLVLSVYGQEIDHPVMRKAWKLDKNLLVPQKKPSKDTTTVGWFQICYGAYYIINGGVGATPYNNILWPDTLVGSYSSNDPNSFSYMWNPAVGATFDPYTISYDSNLTTPVIQPGKPWKLDSLAFPAFYYRDNTSTDTLTFEIVHGLPMQTPAFGGIIQSNPTDTVCSMKYTQNASLYKGRGLWLTDPNKIVRKHLLTDADSTGSAAKYIYVYVGEVIPAGEIVGVMISYSPGNTNYNLGDTVFDYDARMAINGNNALLFIWNDQDNYNDPPLFVDPFGYSLFNLMFPEQRYGNVNQTYLTNTYPYRYGGLRIWGLVDEITGVNEYSNDQNIKLYPNPAEENLFVELEKNSKADYAIYDLIGKVEKVGQLANLKNHIDISDLSTGMYIIQIKTEKKTTSYKFSVK